MTFHLTGTILSRSAKLFEIKVCCSWIAAGTRALEYLDIRPMRNRNDGTSPNLCKSRQRTSTTLYSAMTTFWRRTNQLPLSLVGFCVNFGRHSNVLDITKLIPVIHLQTLDGKRPLREEEVAEIFGSVAAEIECRFIAVPERELGIGLPARARLTRRIAFALHGKSKDCLLHILGCGNLLSFSALAVAGAMMCDGLEWCRTLAADNFHLHHFQHKDLFVDPEYYKGNPAAEFMIEGTTLNYPTSVAVRNLLSFQAFTQSIHARLNQRTVHEFVREHFGNMAGEAIRTLEA